MNSKPKTKNFKVQLTLVPMCLHGPECNRRPKLKDKLVAITGRAPRLSVASMDEEVTIATMDFLTREEANNAIKKIATSDLAHFFNILGQPQVIPT